MSKAFQGSALFAASAVALSLAFSCLFELFCHRHDQKNLAQEGEVTITLQGAASASRCSPCIFFWAGGRIRPKEQTARVSECSTVLRAGGPFCTDLLSISLLRRAGWWASIFCRDFRGGISGFYWIRRWVESWQCLALN